MCTWYQVYALDDPKWSRKLRDQRYPIQVLQVAHESQTLLGFALRPGVLELQGLETIALGDPKMTLTFNDLEYHVKCTTYMFY